MGGTFSSLSGCIGRREKAEKVVVRQQISSPIEDKGEDVDPRKSKNTVRRKYRSANDIQFEDCPDGSDLQIDENREDDDIREPKPSNVVKCTYDVQVYNGGNVVTGDNNTINVWQSDQLTVVGDGNAINLLQVCNLCPDEALNFEQSVRRRLFPLRSEPFMLPSPGVHPELKKVFDRMCGLVDQLHPLRDSGKWQAFEKALNRLHSKYDIHPTFKSFLMLEESVKLTYQKRLKAAKEKAKESLNIVNNETNQISGASQNILRILGNVALASIYRRLQRKKLGKAFNCLKVARESSEWLKCVDLTMPKFALALLDYEQARCLMEFATLVKGESKCCNKEAFKSLGLCIDRCRALSDKNALYVAKQTFALVYLARLSLPTSIAFTEPGQCERAENHLEEYERSHSHLGDYPVAAQVKYLMTRSELCFLKKSYALAKNFACQALDIAVKYGFELETTPAQNRLDQIRSFSGTIRQDKLQRQKNLSSSYSSTTSDSDQKYNFAGTQRAT